MENFFNEKKWKKGHQQTEHPARIRQAN